MFFMQGLGTRPETLYTYYMYSVGNKSSLFLFGERATVIRAPQQRSLVQGAIGASMAAGVGGFRAASG